MPGPHHRRSNDTALALAEVGMGARVAFFNVQYGPFQKSGFQSHEVSETFDANDPVLMHFFPKILHDRNLDASLNNTQERQKYLDGLPQGPFLTSKGPKASLSGFNSLTHAFQHLDGNWHSFAFLLVVASLINGWSKFADEFWASQEVINDKLVLAAAVAAGDTHCAPRVRGKPPRRHRQLRPSVRRQGQPNPREERFRASGPARPRSRPSWRRHASSSHCEPGV